MTIAEQLAQLNANIGTINTEVGGQADLIAQIKNVVDSLPEAGGESTEINLQTKTVTPTTSPQAITADAEYAGLEKVTVNAIPSTYVEPAATKSATTYTPGTSDQTISAGTYCSGVQTIKGDANLIPSNIVDGKTIFGVAGTAASGGGTTEACTILISDPSPEPFQPTFYYTDSSMSLQTFSGRSGSLKVAKNTIIVVREWSSTCSYNGCTQIFHDRGNAAFEIIGDAEFKVS